MTFVDNNYLYNRPLPFLRFFRSSFRHACSMVPQLTLFTKRWPGTTKQENDDDILSAAAALPPQQPQEEDDRPNEAAGLGYGRVEYSTSHQHGIDGGLSAAASLPRHTIKSISLFGGDNRLAYGEDDKYTAVAEPLIAQRLGSDGGGGGVDGGGRLAELSAPRERQSTRRNDDASDGAGREMQRSRYWGRGAKRNNNAAGGGARGFLLSGLHDNTQDMIPYPRLG